MKKLLSTLLLASFSLLAVISCTSSANEVRADGKKGELLGTYRVKLDKKMLQNEIDSMDAGGKFVMSLLSLVKVNITFKENGYAFFDGEFGFLDFNNDNPGDSVRYWIKDNRLFLDEVNIETDKGEDDSFSLKPMDNGVFQLEADSLLLFLEPIR